MSALRGDRALRALERDASGGDPAARARLVLARARHGELPEERLRLAAHLGDPGAVIAARDLLGVVPREQGLGTWIRAVGRPRLEDWPRELPWTPLVQPVCVRAAVVAVELALPVWSSVAWNEGPPDEEDLRLLRSVLGDAQAWVAAPSAALERRAAGRCMGRSLSGLAGDVALELASVVCRPVRPGATSPTSQQREVSSSAAHVVEAAAKALAWQGGKQAEAQLRAAITARTVPWLLEG